MSGTDIRDGRWKPEECSKNLRLVTCPGDACVPAIRFQDCTIRELYYLQGTTKVLHPKPNISVRSAWTASGSVKNTTTPIAFIKGRKTSLRAHNRNNCRTIDKDINYRACDTKVVREQRAINNIQNSEFPQCDYEIEDVVELSTCNNNISFLNSQPKLNQDIINSSCAQQHSESQQTETNQAMTVVEIYPGVTSYILDVAPSTLDNANKSGGKTDNVSNTEEQPFDTLKKRPRPLDNAGMKSRSLDESSRVQSYQDNSEDNKEVARVQNSQDNSEDNKEVARVQNSQENSEANQESCRIQNDQDSSEVNPSNESQLEEQLFYSLKECPDPSDSSDDDTAVSWYRTIVKRELELYLKKLRSNVSKNCQQPGDTTQQSGSSKQNAQQSKIVDSEQMCKLTQSRRINRTARYVSYLLWKDSTVKSKDRVDISERPKVWKPT